MHSSALVDRFWAGVEKRGPDECWPWKTMAHKPRGYGQFTFKGRKYRAHKLSWEIDNGKPFPDGMHGCHSCDNPPCCNPAHIWPGTMSDNIMDAFNKKRVVVPSVALRGAPPANRALTQEQAEQIKLLAKTMTRTDLGKMFGCHRTNIGLIIRGKSYQTTNRKDGA